MKSKPKALIFLIALFTYVVLQFLWWEILLVKQNGQILDEKQKVVALSISNDEQLREELQALQNKRRTKTFMIVGEGTVFLLLLLYGVFKIKQAQEKEEELRRQQNNFFLSITHELKTPIAATKLQLQTIQKQKPNEEIQNELIQNALQETERLNKLIDNVLLASRMESAEFKVELEKINISDLVERIVKLYYSKEQNNGVLTLNIDKNISVLSDEQAFTSIVTNLVDNAIKYTSEIKKIEIKLGRSHQKVILEIKDNGIGISKLDREKVFNKFYRAGNEETRRSKGTGLGLYIVKKLEQGHGCSMVVKENPSGGTVFEIQWNEA